MQRSKIKEEKCRKKAREEKGFHFYRIIHSRVQDQRLAIPKKFTRYFGNKLSSTVVLKVPSKKEWHVELREDEGRVWFQNGLHEFMVYHSIGHGHILVFRYDGFSQFRVVVFDMSGSEINYPCNDLEAQHAVIGCKIPRNCTTSSQQAYISATRTAETISTADPRFRRERDGISARSKSPSCNPGYRARNKKQDEQHTGRQKVHFMVDESENDGLLKLERQDKPTTFAPTRFASSWVKNGNIHLMNNMGNEQEFDPCARSMKRPREFVDDKETHCAKQEGCEVFGSIFKGFAQEGPLLFDCLENHEQIDVSRQSDFTSIRGSSSGQYQMKNIEYPKKPSSVCLDKGAQSYRSNSIKLKTVEVNSHHTVQETQTRKPTELVSVPSRPTSYTQKGKSKIALRTFTSENPFCRVTMRPSYVRGTYILTFPNWFSKKYLKANNPNVNLRVLDGRTWQARCAFGGFNVKLIKGWRKFVLDNALEEDDICTFELVDRDHIELKVSIFRILHNPKQHKRISGQSKNVKCHASDLGRKLHKRDRDTEKKLKLSDEHNVVTHFMVDKIAAVGLSNSESQNTGKPNTSTMPKFAPGWVDKENRKLANSMNFEKGSGPSVQSLKKRKEIIEGRETNNIKEECEEFGLLIMKVTDKDAPGFDSSDNGRPTMSTGRFKVSQEKEIAILATTGFTSANPFCTVTMRSSYVSGNFCLSLPNAFAEKYLRYGYQGVNLRVSNGGVWHAQCSLKEPRKLHKGWKKFVLDNHLKEDDACIFELVDRKHIELSVFIFHSHVHSLQLLDE